MAFEGGDAICHGIFLHIFLQGVLGYRLSFVYSLQVWQDILHPCRAPIVDRIVEKLKLGLSKYGEYEVILGNKHWKPSLQDALSKAKQSGSENYESQAD